MAERRYAGFNIPLSFYDGPEVESISKRIRAAAIGVWALAGNYAATQLTDGYVPAGVLKSFGCTDAIRSALKFTINKKGELSPLWIDARNGGVQLTNWPKHQRTNAEVTTYRAGEAERKRLAREAKRASGSREPSPKVRDSTNEVTPNLSLNFQNGGQNLGDNNGLTVANVEPPTSDDEKTSARTPAGRPGSVRATSGQPKTKTETESLSTYVYESPTDSNGRGSVAATPGADLVREIVPRGHPPATLTSLRLQASELLNTGTERATVEAALRLWCDKPGVGIGRTILASLASESIKARAAPAINGRRIAASDAAVAAVEAIVNPTGRLELE